MRSSFAVYRFRRWTSVLGAIFAVLVLVPGVLGVPGADAQEGEGDEGEQVELKVEKHAYWNNPSARALPDILVSEFPPGVACIVVQQACTKDVEEATKPINENRPKEEEAPGTPAQPVAPDTLPAARNGGELKYVSALQFPLPETPEGKEIASFKLVLREEGPTFSANSPATRQAVLAALVGVQTEDPEAARAEAEKIVQNPETYPPVKRQVLEVEACPITSKWKAGDGPGEGQGWKEVPERDCILGATGTRKENGEWHFDLTMAAQSFEDGSLKNMGIFIGPVAAANFAFGDKETTDNAQASYGTEAEDTKPFALVEYQEKLSSGGAFTLGDGSGGSGGGADTSGSSNFTATDTSGTSGSLSSGTTSTGGTSSSPSLGSGSAPAPDVAPAGSAPQTAPAQGQQANPQAAGFSGEPRTPWWVWTLIPIGGAVAYVLSRSLTTEAVAVVEERAGAMTRLIQERRRDGSLLDPMAHA